MKKYYNIRNIRKKKKIKAEDLARMLKISIGTYYKKETLLIPFMDSELLIQSEVLNTNINRLLIIINKEEVQ